MDNNNNTIKVYTTSNGAELNISAPSTKQVISATNNRAQYFAEQAKKYRDEAKLHRDNAKYYAEQNTNVTFEYIDNVRGTLEDKIATKQPIGDYALREELPINVSELINDAEYVIKSEFDTVTKELELPSQEGCAGKFLMTDGEKEAWVGFNSYQLFDTKLSDKILSYEESKGWALQGTCVYKDAITGSRYGYPDFYEKCLEEYNAGDTITLSYVEGGASFTARKNSNGHIFYNISQKSTVDALFEAYGYAWFYGIDQENERIFLPRNKWFEQVTDNSSEVGQGVEAGLPNITGTLGSIGGGPSKVTGAFYDAGSSTPLANTGENDGLAGFDASRSSGVYGKSNTVQPNAVKKLLYICVGNTIQDTSWVDVVTQVNGGVLDLENATNEGLSALANASNALRQTQITNCLLEVPQRIKLELNDGVLTLKAGSEVIVPNGFEADGTTPKFDYVTVETDATGLRWVGTNIQQYMCFCNRESNVLDGTVQDNITSSTSFPASAGNGDRCYRTDLNELYTYKTSSGAWQKGDALPVGLVSGSGTAGKIGSIDQVFNGFGYMGSIVWVDKGVKGLIPNGRNSDGTLNNIEFTTSSMMRVSARLDNTGIVRLGINDKTVSTRMNGWTFIEQDEQPKTDNITRYTCWYSPKDNIYRDTSDKGVTWSQVYYTFPVWYFGDTTRVTSLHHKEPFRAVDITQLNSKWVAKYLLASTATSIGTYTLDFSEYLPNDGYDYEVLMTIYADRSGDTKGDNSFVTVYNADFGVNGADAGAGQVNSFFSVVLDGANFQQQCGGGVAIITGVKKLTLRISNYNLTNLALNAIAYRRVRPNI